MKKMNLLAGSLIARAAACAACAAFIALAGCSGGGSSGGDGSDPWEEPESPGSPQDPADPGSPDVPEEPLPPGAVTYTVTFIANAPEGESASGEMDPQVFAEGQERVLSANAFSVAGYTFKGWAEVDSAEEPLYTDRQQVLISADTQLYAVWGKADAENPDAPSSDGLSVDGDGNLVVEDAAAVKPDVRIPDGVKIIGGSNAFINGSFCGIYTGFKSITIPASVEEITRYAFLDPLSDFLPIPGERKNGLPFTFIVDEKNQHFKTNASDNMLLSKDGTVLYFVTNSSDDFTIPATVTEIADCAFIYTNIKHLNLDGVKFNNKGTGLFENSPELETVVLKNITAEYTVSMFTNCPKLRSANLSEAGNITDAQGMFSYCTSLTEVKLPDSVTTLIGTFDGCASLTKFAIPASVTKMHTGDQGIGRSLTTVTYPKSIDDYKKIKNNDNGNCFLPNAFGGDVNVTVTCADGKKVIYTSDGTMKAE